MLLTDLEVQQTIAKAQAAFPNLTDWQYNNEKNGEYFGFSLWGQCSLHPEDLMVRYCFITLDTYKEEWYGHLTIGQPYYLWSSADVGDAYLVDTAPCKTCEDAMSVLKGEIANLCRIFSINE